jgi:hypothetical protein
MNTLKVCHFNTPQYRTIYAAVFIICFLSAEALLAEDIIIEANAVWSSGTYNYDNVLVTNNADLTFNGSVTLNAYSLTVDSGASISAKGTGFTAGQGPGTGGIYSGNGTGAGYGGKGGSRNNSGGFVYGSAFAPSDLGSGGSNGNAGANKGGTGGGAIILNISYLTINGYLNANGTDGIIGYSNLNGGGGSGGSIYINTQELAGSGTIFSNGGYGRLGGGAGGRIIAFYQSSSFTGTASAKGGKGLTTDDYGQDGTVAFIDLSTDTFYAGNTFCFDEVDGPFTFNRVILNASNISVEGSIELNTSELSLDADSVFDINGDSTFLTVANLINDGNSAIILSGGSVLSVTSSINISNSSITTNGPQNLVLPSDDIELSDGAILKWGTGSYFYNNVSLTGNSFIVFNGIVALKAFSVSIDQSCSISAIGTGYPGEKGPGVGGMSSGHGTGGGYGGKGGSRNNSGGGTYGNELNPSEMGSGGGNSNASFNISGAGGGAIRLDVNYLTVNGLIASDGSDGTVASGINLYGGGGSGGSILINVKNLYGSGTIRANGGYGRYGAGGGGRAAAYYKNSAFNGTVQAKGGNGITSSDKGQDGTVDVINNIVNSAPVAQAVTDQEVEVGSDVVLDGSSSSDADGDLLIYKWTFSTLPAASKASLNNADTASPDFTADVPGTYVISLIVSDGWLDSLPVYVTIKTRNRVPVAEAGNNQSVTVGSTVTLNGSSSSDPDGDMLTYKWVFTSKPGGSTASLSNPAAVNPTFTADKAGTFILTLIVNDGLVDSVADSVTITAAAQHTPSSPIEQVRQIIRTINAMDRPDLKNMKNKISLIYKLNVVIRKIEKKDYRNAVKKLKCDIIKKTNGCAIKGHPDRDDWIINCDAQAQIYQPILDLIGVLETMKTPGKPVCKAH